MQQTQAGQGMQRLAKTIEGFIILRGPAFHLVEDDQHRLLAQGLPQVFLGLPLGGIATDRPAVAFGQQHC